MPSGLLHLWFRASNPFTLIFSVEKLLILETHHPDPSVYATIEGDGQEGGGWIRPFLGIADD
jgi:hypothetical protein